MAKNLGCIFSTHLGGERPAVVDLSKDEQANAFSYDALNAMADGVARGLRRRGLGVGDRVGVLSLNRIEYLAVFFGSMRMGAVPTPINIKLSSEIVDFILRDAGCKLAFVEKAFGTLVPGSGFNRF